MTVNYFNLFEASIGGMAMWYDGNNVDANEEADTTPDQEELVQWLDVSTNTRNATTNVCVHSYADSMYFDQWRDCSRRGVWERYGA